jgi:hypothetical protein
MKIIKITTILLLITSIFFSCQKKDQDLFSVQIIEKDGLPHISYLPNLKFSSIPADSISILYNDEDYSRILSSDIKIAPTLYKNDVFKVRVYTRSVFNKAYIQHGFLIRTFSKDEKIIDEMVLASTIGGLNCEGKITSDLKIATSCPNGEENIAQIEYDGSIKLIENE